MQDTSMQPGYSDLLWTFQQSQWGGNCRLFLLLCYLVFSQDFFLLFIYFCLGRPSHCPAFLGWVFLSSSSCDYSTSWSNTSKLLLKTPGEPALAHWGQFLNPDWTPNSSWCPKSLSTVPSPCGEGSVPKNSPSSPAQGCPSSPCPIDARYTWIPRISW